MKSRKKWLFPAIYILSILLINFYVIRIAFVYGDSMLPTLHEHQLLIIWQLGYIPNNNDVVITNKNNSLHINLVKRVIALEGQEVEFTTDSILVDGVLLNEPYLSEKPHYTPSKIIVPDNCVLLLGDNRNYSRDSRDIGCLPIVNIIGKVVFPSLE